jgi:hypothetical protein
MKSTMIDGRIPKSGARTKIDGRVQGLGKRAMAEPRQPLTAQSVCSANMCPSMDAGGPEHRHLSHNLRPMGSTMTERSSRAPLKP